MYSTKKLVGCIVGVMLLLTILPLTVYAEVPQRMSYQGYLTDPAGNPVADGSYTMIFAIYDVAVGGAELWSESQAVTVTNGVYDVQIGVSTGTNPFPANLFENNRYLGVTVGSDDEMTPRQLLTTTAFSMHAADADTLDGMDSTSFSLTGHSHSFADITGSASDAQIPDNITINYAATAGSADTANSATTAGSADYATNAGNADTVDGQHASEFAASSHGHSATDINSGTLSTSRYSAISDLSTEGYLGNASGDLAQNNGTTQTNLVADMVDGLHASSFVSDTGDTMSASTSDSVLTVTNSGTGDAISVSAGGDGIYVNRPGAYGVYVYQSGISGVYVNNPNSDGVYVGYPGDDGIQIQSPGNHGVNISLPTNIGVSVINPGSYGLNVYGGSHGVYAVSGTGGFFRDSDTNTYAYIANGLYGILSDGTKSFMQEHPTDSDQVIIYASLEGGEAGTYYRGTAQLTEGTATIELPEHFSLVTEDEGLTVQVTPRADCNGLFVADASTTRIVVKELQGGTSNARFDFFINGVRAGYADYKVMNSKSELGLDEIEEARWEKERQEAERQAEREREPERQRESEKKPRKIYTTG